MSYHSYLFFLKKKLHLCFSSCRPSRVFGNNISLGGSSHLSIRRLFQISCKYRDESDTNKEPWCYKGWQQWKREMVNPNKNEVWYFTWRYLFEIYRSLLIRYPYELTVRGVLKYQLSPYLPYLTQLHSARVCKMARIDPATGKISDGDRNPAKSICDDPSPVEDTD